MHTRFSRVAAAASLSAVTVVASVWLTAGVAAAATCTKVSITGGPAGLTLSPSTVTIKAGGCVTYQNNSTPLPVQVQVGSVKGSADSGNSVTFKESSPGRLSVTASQQPAGGKGSGTLVVKAAPTPTPTPSPHPTPHPSSPPAPQPSQATGPQVAPSVTPPPVSAAPSVPTSTQAPGQGNPPVLAGIPSESPSPSPSSAPAVVAGPLQTPSGRGVGLPAAIAALLVVGGAAAYGRVLLAEPLGDRGPVDTAPVRAG